MDFPWRNYSNPSTSNRAPTNCVRSVKNTSRAQNQQKYFSLTFLLNLAQGCPWWPKTVPWDQIHQSQPNHFFLDNFLKKTCLAFCHILLLNLFTVCCPPPGPFYLRRSSQVLELWELLLLLLTTLRSWPQRSRSSLFCSRTSCFFCLSPISHPKFPSGWNPLGSITIHRPLTGLIRFLFWVGSGSLRPHFSLGWDLWITKKISL